MTDWLVELMEKLGAPGAGLAIALENLFPPLPSEVILPLAGFTASKGEMDLVAVLVCTTLGSVVGALALYWVGALLGRDRTLALAAKLPLVKVEDILKTEAWFFKHGRKTVFFGRMIPIFRSLISVPAGVTRMPLGIFTLLTTTGSLIWNTIFVMAGYTLGENWELVEKYVGLGSNLVVVLVVFALLVFIGVRLNEKYKKRNGDQDEDQDDPGRDGGPADPGQTRQEHLGQTRRDHPGQTRQDRPGQPYQGQPYQGHQGQGQPYQGHPGQGAQNHPGHHRPGPSSHPAPGHPAPSRPGQAHPGQAHPGQGHPGHNNPGQAYPGHPGQPHQGWNTPRN